MAPASRRKCGGDWLAALLVMAAAVSFVASCATPAVLEAPVAGPTAMGVQPDVTPLPFYTVPRALGAMPFAGPDPAAPEGDKPAVVAPGDLAPARD